jgi:hypothetical protein
MAEQSIWKKEISFRRKPKAVEPWDESAEPDGWETQSAVPPAHAEAPTTVVHPPVPASELPPLPDEKPVPFWKKEIAFGRGGKAKSERPEKSKAEKPPKNVEKAEKRAQKAEKAAEKRAQKAEKAAKAEKKVWVPKLKQLNVRAPKL